MTLQETIGKTIKSIQNFTHKDLCEEYNEDTTDKVAYRYWCNSIGDDEIVEIYITFTDDTVMKLSSQSSNCCDSSYVYIE